MREHFKLQSPDRAKDKVFVSHSRHPINLHHAFFGELLEALR
jgi:hypothetical protein